jgi:hypothetical protein
LGGVVGIAQAGFPGTCAGIVQACIGPGLCALSLIDLLGLLFICIREHAGISTGRLIGILHTSCIASCGVVLRVSILSLLLANNIRVGT